MRNTIYMAFHMYIYIHICSTYTTLSPSRKWCQSDIITESHSNMRGLVQIPPHLRSFPCLPQPSEFLPSPLDEWALDLVPFIWPWNLACRSGYLFTQTWVSIWHMLCAKHCAECWKQELIKRLSSTRNQWTEWIISHLFGPCTILRPSKIIIFSYKDFLK
jgi:hypothetical protein